MKWVEINGVHINTNNMLAFFWDDGKLRIEHDVIDTYSEWKDPNMELYRKLCAQLGVKPDVEEKEDGKSL